MCVYYIYSVQISISDFIDEQEVKLQRFVHKFIDTLVLKATSKKQY